MTRPIAGFFVGPRAPWQCGLLVLLQIGCTWIAVHQNDWTWALFYAACAGYNAAGLAFPIAGESQE